MKKRLLSALLALTMALGLLPAALAANQTVPQTPQNVKVKLESMEQGSITTDGYDVTLTGTIATLSVTTDKQEGITEYFIAPLRSVGVGSNTSLLKTATGNMPFIKANLGNGQKPYWLGSNTSTGPNGETLTETDKTLTAQVKVVVYDTEPKDEWSGYKQGEDILIEVRNENGDLPKSSEEVIVKVPAKKTSVGKTFPLTEEEEQEQKKQKTITEVLLSQYQFAYTGSAQCPSVTSVLAGTEVVPAGGYTLQFSNKSSTEPGQYTVTATGTGDYKGSATATYTILKQGDNPTVKVITGATLDKRSFTWNGKVQTPRVTSVQSGVENVPAGSYTAALETPKSKNAGTYYVVVTGKGDYTGSLKLPYKIKQKEKKDLPTVSQLKLTGGRLSFTAEWKPLSAKTLKKKKIEKVQVRYKYKGKTYTKTYKTAKKTNLKVKKLKGKGVYEVRLRYLGKGNKNEQHVSKKWTGWKKVKVK